MDYSVEHEHRKAKKLFTDSIKSGSDRFKARIATAMSSVSIGRKIANIAVSPFSAVHGVVDSLLPVTDVTPPTVVSPVTEYIPAACSIMTEQLPQVATVAALSRARVYTPFKASFKASFKESEKDKIDIDKLLEDWVVVDRQGETLAAR